MIIFIRDINKLITGVEGTGDNLTAEDEAEGLKDYMMTSVYNVSEDEIALEDAGQMMTSELIADLELEEVAQRLLEYWGFDKDCDWVMLDY